MLSFGRALKGAIGALLVIVSLPAPAQEQEGISIGQFKILPTIGLTYGHDDNVTFTNAETNEAVSSNFYVVSPGIRLEAPSDRSIFSLTWAGEFGRYVDSERDDYETWNLRGAWDYDPTSRSSLGLFGDFSEGRDRRGEGRTQGDAGLGEFDPDEYELVSFGGYFDYGAVGARGRLAFEASHTEREYQNNRDRTRFLDRQQDFLSGTAYLRIRPKTSLLVGISITDIDYDFTRPGRASLDSEETHLFVGVEWDATARTSGRVEYGWLEKEFDDPAIDPYDSDFWRIGIDWNPRTYSTFSLTASRETDESDGFGAYVLREDVTLSWNHSWTTRFSTTVQLGIGTDDHRPDFREDDFEYWGVSGRWQLSQRLQFGISYQDYWRDSSLDEYIYDRNVWLLTLEGSL